MKQIFFFILSLALLAGCDVSNVLRLWGVFLRGKYTGKPIFGMIYLNLKCNQQLVKCW